MSQPAGLYGKFSVQRVDGRDRGGDRSDARYFVLDYVHDPIARATLGLYANLAEQEGLPELARDLRAELAATTPKDTR